MTEPQHGTPVSYHMHRCRCMECIPHGRFTSYNVYGCRCSECRKAMREHMNARRRDRFAARVLVAGRWHATNDSRGHPLPHGAVWTYKNWGCRCGPCTAANTDYQSEYKHRTAITRPPRRRIRSEDISESPPH